MAAKAIVANIGRNILSGAFSTKGVQLVGPQRYVSNHGCLQLSALGRSVERRFPCTKLTREWHRGVGWAG